MAFCLVHPFSFLNEVSDIALVKNNASIGAKIAVSLAQLQKRSYKRLVHSKSVAILLVTTSTGFKLGDML